jgi:hypothetical protein
MNKWISELSEIRDKYAAMVFDHEKTLAKIKDDEMEEVLKFIKNHKNNKKNETIHTGN